MHYRNNFLKVNMVKLPKNLILLYLQTFWIKGFENKRSIPADEFIEKFGNFVFATEHVSLTKIQKEWLKK